MLCGGVSNDAHRTRWRRSPFSSGFRLGHSGKWQMFWVERSQSTGEIALYMLHLKRGHLYAKTSRRALWTHIFVGKMLVSDICYQLKRVLSFVTVRENGSKRFVAHECPEWMYCSVPARWCGFGQRVLNALWKSLYLLIVYRIYTIMNEKQSCVCNLNLNVILF